MVLWQSFLPNSKSFWFILLTLDNVIITLFNQCKSAPGIWIIDVIVQSKYALREHYRTKNFRVWGLYHQLIGSIVSDWRSIYIKVTKLIIPISLIVLKYMIRHGTIGVYDFTVRSGVGLLNTSQESLSTTQSPKSPFAY